MIEVNLLDHGPPIVRDHARRLPTQPTGIGLRRAMFPVLCAVLAIGYSSWSLLSLSRTEAHVANRIEALVSDSLSIALRDERASNRLQHRDSVARRLEALEAIEGQRKVWPHLLAEIAMTLPNGVRLTRLEAMGENPVQVLMEGVASGRQHISDYLRRLERSPYLIEITPEPMGVDEPLSQLTGQIYPFRLTLIHDNSPGDLAFVNATQGSEE